MAPEGHQGAAIVEVIRIDRGHAIDIDHGARRHRNPLVLGNAHFAFGNLGSGNIQGEWLVLVYSWHSPCKWVGSHHASARAVGGNRRTRIGHGDPDHSRSRDGFDIGRHAPDMETAIDRANGDSVLARQCDRFMHRKMERWLTPTPLAIDLDRGAVNRDHLRQCGGIERSGFDDLDVLQDANDAMRIVAGQIGGHQRVTNEGGTSRAACRPLRKARLSACEADRRYKLAWMERLRSNVTYTVRCWRIVSSKQGIRRAVSRQNIWSRALFDRSWTSNLGFLPFVPAHDPLQELARFRHDVAETVQIEQDVEQLLSLEMLDRIGQLAAFAQRSHQILPRLRAPLKRIAIEFAHSATSAASGGRVQPAPK